MNPPQRVILASHLIHTGYGHWLSNDPRGSGSDETRKKELDHLGPIHHGRKSIQPPRETLREFYREAKPLLDFETVWFDRRMRKEIASGFAEALKQFGYTCFAFAILRNHAHAVVRAHRDRAEIIWDRLAIASGDALRNAGLVAPDHPIWSHRPYKVFKHSPAELISAVRYVELNPEKEGLPRQVWDFVSPYLKR